MKQQIPKFLKIVERELRLSEIGSIPISTESRHDYIWREFMKKPSGHSVKSLLFNLSNLNMKFIKKNSTI